MIEWKCINWTFGRKSWINIKLWQGERVNFLKICFIFFQHWVLFCCGVPNNFISWNKWSDSKFTISYPQDYQLRWLVPHAKYLTPIFGNCRVQCICVLFAVFFVMMTMKRQFLRRLTYLGLPTKHLDSFSFLFGI